MRSRLLLFLHLAQVSGVGTTMKTAFCCYQKPHFHPGILSVLFCQCDPFMRTDWVIWGRGAGYSFTIRTKASTPKSRAAVGQAQGSVNSRWMAGAWWTGDWHLCDLLQRNTTSGTPGTPTLVSWKEPTLPLGTCWPWTIILAFVSSSDKWE